MHNVTPLFDHCAQLCSVYLNIDLCRYPLSHLSRLLWLSDEALLADYLRGQGVKVEDDMVMFGVRTEAQDEEVECYYQHLCERVRNESSSGLERLILGESTM